MVLGWLFMVVLAVVIMALLVWGVSTPGRALWARRDQDGKERPALRMLEERFASGAIHCEESERRREILAGP